MKRCLTLLMFAVVAGILLTIQPVVASAATVCIECHGKLAGELGEIPVAHWETSIHARHRVSCHDCHGGDPTDYAMAMTAERGFIGVPAYEDIPAFCGRCHVGVEEDYRESLHGQVLSFGGPHCATCHDNHAVQVATIDLINEISCSRCHSYERPARIREQISATEQMLTRLESSIASLYRVGVDTSRFQEDLFATRNSFRRLFHSVDIDKIRAETARFDEDLEQTRTALSELEETLGTRKLVGGALVLLLLLGGCIGLLIKRTYDKD